MKVIKTLFIVIVLFAVIKTEETPSDFSNSGNTVIEDT